MASAVFHYAPCWAVELFDGWERHNLFIGLPGSMNDPYAQATRGLRVAIRAVALRPEGERPELARALLAAQRMGGAEAARTFLDSWPGRGA